MITEFILAIIAILSILIALGYRRQLVTISRQLKFYNKHNSNLMISKEFGDKKTMELVDCINEMLDQVRCMKRDYQIMDENLKGTITNLSHDIRTPLTSLDGYFQLLTDSKEEEERTKYIKIIKERINSLKDMLEELFTYTKLQSNDYSLELKKYNLNKILYETIFSFYDDFKTLEIEPEIEIGNDSIYILCNDVALKRIIQNIIKNTLVHGKDNISVKMEQMGSTVRISFSNNFEVGEDMDIEQVFERFYKADTARNHTSTGLGLSIARELALKMGGTIDAQKNINTFLIQLSFPIVE